VSAPSPPKKFRKKSRQTRSPSLYSLIAIFDASPRREKCAQGDTITSVDGKGTSSGFSMLRGPAWSRVTLSVTRRVKSKWMVVGSEMLHGVDGGEEDAAVNGGGGDAAASADAHEDEDEGETYRFTLDIVRCPAMGRTEQVEAATSYREQVPSSFPHPSLRPFLLPLSPFPWYAGCMYATQASAAGLAPGCIKQMMPLSL
jgi:hypothetical protein